MAESRLLVQALDLPDHTRVEIGFDTDARIAVLAYDDPREALVDATRFLQAALDAVRADTAREP